MKNIIKKFVMVFSFLIFVFIVSACDFGDNGETVVEDVRLIYRNIELITLDEIGNGSDNSVVLAVGKPGAPVSVPDDLQKENHRFLGWFANSELTEPYIFSVFPDSDTTLYAGWEVLTYQLTFQFNLRFTMEEIALNESLALMVDSDGDLWCWGIHSSSFGSCPVLSSDGHNTIWPGEWQTTLIKAWNQQAFIITEDGRVFAWGENHLGQLGTGDRENRDRFVDITPLFMLEEGETIIDIAGSSTNTYAISSAGKVYAWGVGRGISMMTGRSVALSSDGEEVIDNPLNITDTLPLGLDEIILRISASTERAFAFSNEGKVYAWGRNNNQELGFEEEHPTQEVVQITDLFRSGDEVILDIGGDEYGFFVVKDNREICMLSQTFSATDNHTITCSATPYDGDEENTNETFYMMTRKGSGIARWTTIEEGKVSSVYFWGSDTNDIFGEDHLYTETFIEIQNTPPVASSKSIAMTEDTMCALDDQHTMWCWGRAITSGETDEFGFDDMLVYDEQIGNDSIEITPKSNDEPSETLSLSFAKITTVNSNVPYDTEVFGDLLWWEHYNWFVDNGILTAETYFEDYACVPANACYGVPNAPETLTLIVTLKYNAHIKTLWPSNWTDKLSK